MYEEYPKEVLRSDEEADKWVERISGSCLKIFIELFLRYGETFPYPNLSVHNRYPSDVLKTKYNDFNEQTKNGIKMVLNELLDEFIFGTDPYEYFFNLIVAIANLRICSNVEASERNIRKPFNILCEIAERWELHETGAYAYNMNLHLFLLRVLFGFPIHEEDKKRIFKICRRDIKIAEYASICYRQIFDMYPEEGVHYLLEYLGSTREKNYEDFDYIFPIKIFFNRLDTADIILEDIKKKKFSKIIRDILPFIIKLDKVKDFKEVGLINIEKLIPPSDAVKGYIKLKIAASNKILHLESKGKVVHGELLSKGTVFDRVDIDIKYFSWIFESSEKARMKKPIREILRYMNVLKILEKFDASRLSSTSTMGSPVKNMGGEY